MQALVLAGGEGTRLRPLTLTTPKPVLPLAGRPFLSFMLDWLHRHGVEEAILSLGFLSDAVHAVLGDIQSGMRLRYVLEDEPLGTAGPVRLAADEGILADRFFVLNGDVLTDMDLTAELARHEQTGAAGTLALIEVDDVASYGVVPTDDGGEVLEFTVVGTAVRAPWISHPPGQPIVTDLSGQELWALMQDGYEPCGFLFEFCRYHVWHVTKGVGFGATELTQASDAVERA
ncbi:MAG: mannose-phosphate guanylyltransferase, partial [Thermoleophilaceae bacterium]|nr:mannose-phosphate guanylyltransferase [Thermoleophilaceae bacterium]